MGWLVVMLLLGLCRCSPQAQEQNGEAQSAGRIQQLADGRYKVFLAGETMGTTYHITYLANAEQDYQSAIDSLLVAFNACLSTYDPQSSLSLWNRSESGLAFSGTCAEWMLTMLELSQEVNKRSDGAFDPTVGPLVRYWGFGKRDTLSGSRSPGDSAELAALMPTIGLNLLSWSQASAETGGGLVCTKSHPGTELDFSAIAKGYGVDLVADWLSEQGLSHFLVEIGGEVRAAGSNDRNQAWSIAVEKPIEGVREVQTLLYLRDAGMATSGNYRQFREQGGARYGHILNPRSGKPESSNLLSATILAPTCALADALATACMVLGAESSLDLIESLQGVEGYLIYADSDGEAAVLQSSGMSAAAGAAAESP